MKQYRIVEKTKHNDGYYGVDTTYKIERKFLCFWIEVSFPYRALSIHGGYTIHYNYIQFNRKEQAEDILKRYCLSDKYFGYRGHSILKCLTDNFSDVYMITSMGKSNRYDTTYPSGLNIDYCKNIIDKKKSKVSKKYFYF